MTEGMELIPREPIDPKALFLEGKGIDELLEKIRERAFEHGQDVSTAEGQATVKSVAYQIARSKTFLVEKGDETIEAEKAIVAKAKKNQNKIKDYLTDLKTEYRQPLTDFEETEKRREKERIAGVKVEVNKLKSVTASLGFNSQMTHLTEALRILQEWSVEPDQYFEFTAEAEEEKTKAIQTIEGIIENRKQREKEDAERKELEEKLAKERAELDRQKKEQEEKDRIEREKREAAEAKLRAEQEQLAAEKREIEEAKARLEAEKQAEIERKNREAREKREAEEARIQAEKDAKDAADRAAKEEADRKKAKADEIERQERLLPDKARLSRWVENKCAGSISLQSLQSDEANSLYGRMLGKFEKLMDEFKEMVEEL